MKHCISQPMLFFNLFVFRLLCSIQAICYVIFLLALSFSLISGSMKADPTQYKGAAEFLRGFCEILTLIMTVFYICEELNQMRK